MWMRGVCWGEDVEKDGRRLLGAKTTPRDRKAGIS